MGRQLRNDVPFSSEVIEVEVDPDMRLSFICTFITGVRPKMTLGTLVDHLARGLALQACASGVIGKQVEVRLCSHRSALQAAMLVLLYMGLRDARLEYETKSYSPDAGRGSMVVMSAQSKAKRHRGPVALHRIRVGPDSFDDEHPAPRNSGTGGSRNVAAQWRQGHFCMQAYGQGLGERRQLWRKPVFVAAARLTEPLPIRKYDAGSMLKRITGPPDASRVQSRTTGSGCVGDTIRGVEWRAPCSAKCLVHRKG